MLIACKIQVLTDVISQPAPASVGCHLALGPAQHHFQITFFA